MSVTSGFFNSVNGDKIYNADDLTNFFDGVLSDGVFPGYGASLAVTAGTGMSVNVGAGKALVMGKYIINSAILNLTINASDSLPRYDAVVVGVNLEDRTGTIYVKTGNPASTPAYPTLYNNANTKELCLAYIYVNSGTTTLTSSKITDQRATSNCGYVELSNVNASLNVLRNDVQNTTAGTNTVSIGISDYDPTSDTLQVFKNGILLIPTTDYLVNTSTLEVDFSTALAADDYISFIAYKLTV